MGNQCMSLLFEENNSNMRIDIDYSTKIKFLNNKIEEIKNKIMEIPIFDRSTFAKNKYED